jgi:carbon-monoxide dehydrogenase medium subunit
VKPPPFRYHDPTSLDEVLSLKSEHGADAAVLAGGQSLVAMMNLRLTHPEVLIDINRIPGLESINKDEGMLQFGATVRQHRLEDDDAIRGDLPLLANAARFIGHRELRHRGTVGGSIAHADPAAELPCLALAVRAEIVAASSRGERVIPAGEFFEGFFTTTLEPDEVVTAVRFPVLDGAGWGFEEIARRHGDFALAAAAAVVRMDGGRVSEVSISLAGVSNRPVRAEAVEQAVKNSSSPAQELPEIARLAVDLVTAPDDAHATTAYRRNLAAVVTERSVAAALNRAGE